MEKVKETTKEVGKKIADGTKAGAEAIKSGYNKTVDYVKDADKKSNKESSSN